MLRKVMMFAVAAAALAAFVVPTTASARWQHNGGNLGQDSQVQIHGSAKFTGQSGGVECEVTATGQFTAGTTTGHVQAFQVDQTGTKSVTEVCQPFGFLGEVCVDVHFMTSAGFPWAFHATSKQTLSVTSGLIQIHLSSLSFLCPKTIELTPGTFHFTTEKIPFGKGQLSGQLVGHFLGGGIGNMTVSGQGAITPEGTYGVL